jgi:cytochrome P450
LLVCDLRSDPRYIDNHELILPGSDTTATSMSATFFYLSRNRECREKLSTTIRETFASADEICTGPRLSSCHYLRACIDEAMRMSPPIGTALWREVCDGGIIIDGEYIPPGVDVGSSLYSIHHTEDYFDDPWTYDPDRWMKPPAPDVRKLNQQLAFNPFSLGSRKCVAQTMSYTEISITLAKALWYFDFRIPRGPLSEVGGGVEGASKGRHRPQEFQLWEHLTSQHDGPFLELRLRKRPAG